MVGGLIDFVYLSKHHLSTLTIKKPTKWKIQMVENITVPSCIVQTASNSLPHKKSSSVLSCEIQLHPTLSSSVIKKKTQTNENNKK